jgi:hypothetical protein
LTFSGYGDFIMRERQLCVFIFILLLTAATAPAYAGVTFTDVTEAAGLGDTTATYATWGDYDNDGDADMALSGRPFGRRLYRNEGDGTFLDVTEAAGITSRGPNAPIFLDFDNDGNLDLFMSGNKTDHGDLLYQNKGDGTFIDVSHAAGMESKGRQQSYINCEAVCFDYDNDGFLDIFVNNFFTTPPFPNFLYHNLGNGRFKEIAAQIGLDKSELDGVVPGDYDNDGDLDLFITVHGNALNNPDPDDQGIDMLYRNEGSGVFIDVAQQAGVRRHANHLSGFFWDYDNDGDLDLFVRALQYGDVYGFNILYRNDGDGTFTEVTQQAGILPVEQNTMGTDYGDYDNDGWLDLCVTYESSGSPGLLPVLLYHNNRDGTFTVVSRQAGISIYMDSDCVNFVDYDNDGDLDIFFLAHLAVLFYRNEGTDNHWLKLKLVGIQSNRDAIGARVKVMAGGLSMLREIAASSHQVLHPDHLPIHFGLGQNPKADVIDIRWPSGITQTFSGIAADQHLTIDEMEGILVVVRRVFPDSGFPAGGTPVRVEGEHFLPGSRVFLGGIQARDVRVESPSLITALTPPGASGFVDVEVVHPDGKRGVLKNGFRYTTVQVVGIIPESGPTAGGTAVEIDGFGFQQRAEVQVGENLLANTYVTPVLIRGTLPPGARGVVDVSVTNPNGEGIVVRRAFTYIPPPAIERVSRTFAPLRGGLEITIRGSEFTGTPSVQIGGVAAQRVDFISSGELNISTPQLPDVGPQDVVVINPDGQRAVLPSGVTALAPIKIRTVQPTSGGLEGGTQITIVGEATVEVQGRSFSSRFVEGAEVFIGDARARGPRSPFYLPIVQSDHVITAITPPNTPGSKDVTVINVDGQEDTLKDAFTYNVLPDITRVIPDNGKLAGGTVITIRGSGFLPGARVIIVTETGTYKAASSVQVVSPETIMALTPPSNPGARDVVVRNPDKQEMILPEGFTYNPMPTIIRITPDHGTSAGGTKLIIEGTGFLQGARVMVGERAGTTMVKDDMTIEAVTPPNPPGLWDVHVINPDTQEAVVREAFVSVGELVYNYPNPFLASEGTTFRYVTNQYVEVITVKIFNLRGVPIGIVQGTGSNEVKWHNPSVHVGLYVYLLEARLEDGQVKKFKNMLEVCK